MFLNIYVQDLKFLFTSSLMSDGMNECCGQKFADVSKYYYHNTVYHQMKMQIKIKEKISKNISHIYYC